MLSNNEKEIRFEAIKYYMSGQGGYDIDGLKTRFDDFVDGDESTQKVRIKEYVENKMLPQQIEKVTLLESGAINLDTARTELQWLQDYIK